MLSLTSVVINDFSFLTCISKPRAQKQTSKNQKYAPYYGLILFYFFGSYIMRGGISSQNHIWSIICGLSCNICISYNVFFGHISLWDFHDSFSLSSVAVQERNPWIELMVEFPCCQHDDTGTLRIFWQVVRLCIHVNYYLQITHWHLSVYMSKR